MLIKRSPAPGSSLRGGAKATTTYRASSWPEKKNALTGDREEKARVEVRRILETGPLSLDDAIKREREWRRQKKELSEDPEVADYVEARFVELANDDGVLRELAADRLERAVPPAPWRDYALAAASARAVVRCEHNGNHPDHRPACISFSARCNWLNLRALRCGQPSPRKS